MKHIASVVVDGVEEAGIVTNMFDIFGNDTFNMDKAETVVVHCSVGFLTVSLADAPIYTLQ